MTSSVLITGSEGFLGRRLVASLRRQRTSDLVRVVRPGSRATPVAGTRILTADLRAGWPQGAGPIDQVVHLAWEGLDDFRSSAHESQIQAHIDFLDGALAAGVRRLLTIGTCLEYGMVEGELNEDLPPRPTLPYARAKATVAAHFLSEAQRLDVEALWGRVFYPYGPGQAQRSLWSSVHRAIDEGHPSVDLSPGDQERDFLPVEDVGRMLSTLLDATAWRTGPVNICSGRPTAVRDLVAGWIAAAGSTLRVNLGALPYPDYEPHSFWGSRALLDGHIRGSDPGATNDGAQPSRSSA